MATHRGGTTPLNGGQYLQVQPGEPGGRPIEKSAARCSDEIGQLQEWPLHLLPAVTVFRIRPRREREGIEGTCRGFEMSLRQMQVPAGWLPVALARDAV